MAHRAAQSALRLQAGAEASNPTQEEVPGAEALAQVAEVHVVAVAAAAEEDNEQPFDKLRTSRISNDEQSNR